MDDFPNDASTSGLYNVRDQPISGINEDFSDVDWIRVTDLKTWHFYNVWFYSSEVRPRSTSLRLVDARGDVIDFLTFGFPDRGEYQHTVTGSGNSLQVRLDWDSELDANTDSIRIFNMNDPQSQVETLTLSNPDGQFARVDLLSVFAQSDGTRRRFEVLTESSEFGNLVVPI